MISLTDIRVAFADFVLLDDITISINPRDRIALVGKNGAGKSTLLKILAKVQKPTGGAVVLPNDVRLGYLPQHMEHAKDKTVLEECLKVYSHVDEMRAEADRLAMELASREDYNSPQYHKLIERLNEANDRLQFMSAENPVGNAERTLIGLGFKRKDLDRPTAEFSEGWNMRIELAKVLLSKPNLLLLDEPTNHLDIESLQWLEEYLTTYSGAMLVISHDRAFLDNVTNRTIEIVFGKIYDYKAHYSDYLVLRAERMAQQRAAYDNQQRMIEKTQEFIDRFRYKPTKSNQVQSRIKMLDKVEHIVIDDEDNSSISIKFPPVPRSGQVVFKCSDLAVRYDADPIFRGANIIIERGEKVAFVGRNGEGKTTMMKLIVGILQQCEGEAQIGYNVTLGYYAQNQMDVLNPKLTVYETVDNIAVGDVRLKLRDILAAFLFRGEDVDKKVEVLSGGERSRLAMAKLMLQPYNFLALDEPTNHMDIRSKAVMKDALLKYDGTLLVVSHDRVFLDGLVDKIYEFRDGEVREHLGGLQDFLRRRKLESMRELDSRGGAIDEEEARQREETLHRKSEAQVSYQAKKAVDRQLRKLRQTVEQLEKSIEMHEQGLALMDAQLANPKPEGFSQAFYQLYDKEKKGLEMDMEKWAQATEDLEQFCKDNDIKL